ncbi:MAG: OB-fold nucleic acid binding domain-containing protein [Promethearchaeota archaeon]
MKEEVTEIFKPIEKETCKCPSCGKTVPKNRSCRICGAKMTPRERYSLKKIHILVIIIGISGIGLMLYGYYEATKITPINQINANMEGQTVRIQGIVSDIDYDERYEKTSFVVNDSTGSITCFGWSDFTSSLKKADALPSIGDSIFVEGKVDVYNSSGTLIVQLLLNSYESYRVIWEKAESKKINDILLNDLNKKVVFEGNITDRYASYSGTSVNYMFLTIEDDTGDITVFISGALFSIAGDRAVYPEKGQNVRIIGMVRKYQGQLEIMPSNTTKGAIIILE